MHVFEEKQKEKEKVLLYNQDLFYITYCYIYNHDNILLLSFNCVISLFIYLFFSNYLIISEIFV